MNLERLGATPQLRAALAKLGAPGLTLARVTLSQRDRYRLIADSGELDAEPSGALWYNTPSRAAMPVVGDWVAARVVSAGQAIVEAVLPRRTLFARRAPGRREDQQSIAANIDLVFLVCGLDGDFNLRRLERYLTLSVESGAGAVVVLNKSDLCADVAERLAEAATVAGAAPVVAVHTLNPAGLGALRPYLADGRTVALLGSSGVGKSSLVNCLLGEDRLRTGNSSRCPAAAPSSTLRACANSSFGRERTRLTAPSMRSPPWLPSAATAIVRTLASRGAPSRARWPTGRSRPTAGRVIASCVGRRNATRRWPIPCSPWSANGNGSGYIRRRGTSTNLRSTGRI